ncbi:MAG TPA: FAD-binding and (Fe-S)-binding domain-containing protein [Candidatus Micrarchaeaceae archaeon]|nr:FAD-binding and (Fe-S)-binding domain-containing protein [Candidatus Micrarchaeaceae archaeon]
MRRVPGAELVRDLRNAVRGEVRFSAGDRALYSTDASIYRKLPIGVVQPLDIPDALTALSVCRDHGVAVLPRGAGTSQAGQSCNQAVVLDFSRHVDRILEIDPERRLARVEPGVPLDRLREEAERFHLTFGPDPSTHQYCTLGGMIGNDSCGVHSVTSGTTVRNVESLDVVTYRGLRVTLEGYPPGPFQSTAAPGSEDALRSKLKELGERVAPLVRARFPDIPRRVSGYNLDQLLPERGPNLARAFVGTEGTCAVLLEATVRLVDSPRARTLLVLGYPDVADAADAVPLVLELSPTALEGIDDRLVAAVRRRRINLAQLDALPPGGGWLLVEFGGATQDEATTMATAAVHALRHRNALVLADPAEIARFWQIRESALGATAQAPGRGPAWPGWEDSAVPPARMGDYLRELRRLLESHNFSGAFYGHFGDGCLHTLTDFELTSKEGVSKFRAYVEAAADLVVGFGGSLSGEHGDGQARGELLARMFGPELVAAFREFKRIWDPDGRMNPGKAVEARPLDADLRLAALRPTARFQPTRFRFAEDGGSLGMASRRCVGVGKCTRPSGGTMCPSYMVTREERHSTRGRARLLFELLETGSVPGGWRSREVKDALDLCLACKGCRGECPVEVDMATYKAEFLAHYYSRRLRPRAAYAMGLIHWWAAWAAAAPRAVNGALRAPGLGTTLKWLAGIAPQRTPPTFATQTFRAWFSRRSPKPAGGERVVLFVDTFNDNFRPDTARAALEVLEAMGLQVVLPARRVCCGRPLYDSGMLKLARRQLTEVLDTLGNEIQSGTPIIGLEPSCIAVFKDELLNLMGDRADARRLAAQTQSLSDFVAPRLASLRLRQLGARGLVQGHCHQQALAGVGSDRTVVAAAGVTGEFLDAGCCGMAGAFGYERGEHYRVAIACGERALLPAVRAADPETLILASGFSCREQIEQVTGRPTLHVADVLRMALVSE